MKKIKYYALICLIYIGVLWPWLQYSFSGLFSYWDELLSLLVFPLFIFLHKKIDLRKEDYFIWILILLFIFVGFLGNFLNKFTSLNSAILDGFLNIKFFMLLYSVSFVFYKFDFESYLNKIKLHINFITCILLTLVLLDRLFVIFPVYEIRFGIRSEQLIFSHPSFCASVFFYLLMLRFLFDLLDGKKNVFLNLAIIITIFLTLRFKAIATMIIILLLIFCEYSPNSSKVKVPIILFCMSISIIICFKQFWGYFLSPTSMEYARGALFITCFKIMKDFFPLGTGFATFGSYLSGVNYSSVYHLYNIDTVYGMTKLNFNAISDQYWPMIAGQAGVLGLILMIVLWLLVFIKGNLRIKSKINFVTLNSCFIYILICSTAESAICNPVCMPLAIILGIIFSKDDMRKEL